jgi:hypothetical protein
MGSKDKDMEIWIEGIANTQDELCQIRRRLQDRFRYPHRTDAYDKALVKLLDTIVDAEERCEKLKEEMLE